MDQIIRQLLSVTYWDTKFDFRKKCTDQGFATSAALLKEAERIRLEEQTRIRNQALEASRLRQQMRASVEQEVTKVE